MHCFHSSSVSFSWRAVVLFLLLPLFLLGLSSYKVDGGEVEITDDGSILQPGYDPTGEIPVYFDNKSKFRIDIYWDDGKLGKKVAIMNPGEEGRMIKAYMRRKFFVTQHGGGALFDGGTQLRFTASAPQQVFVIPETAVVCRDRYPVCAELASRGHCNTQPGWMIVNCCESCDPIIHASRLVHHKVRCTRDFLNVTDVPAWRPGDLNKLFTSWATDEKYTKYEPQVVSSPDSAYGGISGPWVIVFDNFLSDEEVAALIEGGRLEGFEHSKEIGEMKVGESSSVLSQGRTSSTAWCRSTCELLPGVRSVSEKVEEITGIPRTNYEKIQVLEYEEGQYYLSHHDAAKPRVDITPGQRIMTWFFYLSNVEEGGETYFNNLDIAVKPKKGRALVWPSVTDEDPEFWDTRMYHEAKAVIKGKKFAANYWIHLYDYQTAVLWGCIGGLESSLGTE